LLAKVDAISDGRMSFPADLPLTRGGLSIILHHSASNPRSRRRIKKDSQFSKLDRRLLYQLAHMTLRDSHIGISHDVLLKLRNVHMIA